MCVSVSVYSLYLNHAIHDIFPRVCLKVPTCHQNQQRLQRQCYYQHKHLLHRLLLILVLVCLPTYIHIHKQACIHMCSHYYVHYVCIVTVVHVCMNLKYKTCTCTHVCMSFTTLSMCTCICIYVYVTFTYMYMYMCIYVMYMYMYMFMHVLSLTQTGVYNLIQLVKIFPFHVCSHSKLVVGMCSTHVLHVCISSYY